MKRELWEFLIWRIHCGVISAEQYTVWCGVEFPFVRGDLIRRRVGILAVLEKSDHDRV
jgi:hypothetical protein